VIVWSLYKITNKNNGKLYFGQTLDSLPKRWWEHCWKASREEGCPALGAAIRKHGEAAFSIELMALRFDAEEADQLERELIGRFKTTEKAFGYNISKGGKGYHPVYCRNGGHKLDRSGGCRICARYWHSVWSPPDGTSRRQYFNQKQIEYTARVDADPEARELRLKKSRECEKRRRANATPEQRAARLEKQREKNRRDYAALKADPVKWAAKLAYDRKRRYTGQRPKRVPD
jgi:hypothetical protein